MNKNFYKKSQAKLFKILNSGHTIMCAVDNDGYTAVCATGFEVFLIPLEKLLLNPAAMKPLNYEDATKNGMLCVRDDDVRLEPTFEFVLWGDVMCRKLTGGALTVYVRDEYLRDFKECALVGHCEKERILAIDDAGNAVGAIWPVVLKENRDAE